MSFFRPVHAHATFSTNARAAVAFVGVLAVASAAVAKAPPGQSAADAQLREAWRTAIAGTPTPAEGCFTAFYPGTVWSQVACKAAPARPYIPRSGRATSRTVGDGNDYAAVSTKLTTSATGSFPASSGVKSEKGYGGAANTYSLQLNSGFMSTAACNSSSCLAWEQFVYSSSEKAAFMQYWLIDYGSNCPSGGWMAYQSSCYKNSAAVSVPQLPITQIGGFKVSGTAAAAGLDTMVFTTPTAAYTTTGKDSVVDLASAWTETEFNVVGDGGGSSAKFNKGTSITVQIALKDGAMTAPQCQSSAGTTGETNNLTLGSCTTARGKAPSVTFTQSN